jgi:hypothetical protein
MCTPSQPFGNGYLAVGSWLKNEQTHTVTMFSKAIASGCHINRHIKTLFLFTKSDILTVLIPVVRASECLLHIFLMTLWNRLSLSWQLFPIPTWPTP